MINRLKISFLVSFLLLLLINPVETNAQLVSPDLTSTVNSACWFGWYTDNVIDTTNVRSTVTETNIGTGQAAAHNSRKDATGTAPGCNLGRAGFSVPLLSPTGSTSDSQDINNMSVSCSQSGTLSLTSFADHANTVAELNEVNNNSTLIPLARCTSGADLIVDNLSGTSCQWWIGIDPVSGLPRDYTTVYYNVTFRNQGFQNAAGFNSRVFLYDLGGNQLASATLGPSAGLSSGAFRTESGSVTAWFKQLVSGYLSFEVDDPNTVAESTDANNTFSNPQRVPFTCNPITTPTPGGPTSTPMATPTLPPNGWYFRGNVYETATTNWVGGGIISLYGSNSVPVLGSYGTFINSDTPQTVNRCAVGQTCNWRVDAPSFPCYQYYSIVKTINPSGYQSDSATETSVSAFVGSPDWIYYDFGSPCNAIGYYYNNNFYVSLGPTPTPPPAPAWFQVQGGNALAKNLLRSPIPTTAVSRDFNSNITDVASVGISYHNSFWWGDGNPGKNAKTASTFLPLLTSSDLKGRFNSIRNISLTTMDYTFWNDTVNHPKGSSGQTEVYYNDKTLTISGNWSQTPNIFDGNAVIFVNGSLNIDATGGSRGIRVADGDFLGFVTTGDINIDSSIGVASSDGTTPTIEGFYFTDKYINTGQSTVSGRERVNFRGTFVGREGINLQRNLNVSNDSYPAETFSYRPDFQISAPNQLKYPYRFWQELAP